MPNTTSNQDYIEKYNIIENRFGMQIRNGDRNDNFFREAEYITAAAFSGLDLVLYEPYEPKQSVLKKFRTYVSVSGIKLLLKKLSIHLGILESDKPPSHKYLSQVKSMILVFSKKKTEYIPHVWHGLGKSSDRKSD